MRKIMIIDDDEILRLLYADELHEEGYDVVTAGAAPDLLTLVDANRPDVVILDERLRAHGGVDLLKTLRARYHSLPVILSTLLPAQDGQAADDGDCIVKASDVGRVKAKLRRIFAVPSTPRGQPRSMPSGAAGTASDGKGAGGDRRPDKSLKSTDAG